MKENKRKENEWKENKKREKNVWITEIVWMDKENKERKIKFSVC